jgi:outer membrane receptor protein involved in Fe transport
LHFVWAVLTRAAFHQLDAVSIQWRLTVNFYFLSSRTALKAFLIFAGLALFLAGSSLAQTETGQISGVVTDPSGATVPKAKVTVSNAATGAARDTTTDDHGAYAVTHLLPSIYTVAVEAAGFSKMEQRIEVTVGAKVDLNFALTVGAAVTTVEVIGSAVAQVNTETQTLGQVVTSKEISEALSLNANPYSFVAISGNLVDSDASPSGMIGVNTGAGAGVVINGLRAASTNILLDGAANNDEFVGTLGQPVPLESVQEFSVLTNNFTAEYGRASAGIVNVATKSGGNAFHGSAYEINRLSTYGANDYANNASGIKRPVYTRNQFGGSVGGPIKKDKLFFFVSPEWTRVRSSLPTQAVIPDQNLISASDLATTQAFFTAFGQLRSNDTTITSYSRASDVAGQNTGLDAACAASAACNAAFPAGSTTTLFRRVQYSVPSDAGGGNPQNTYDFVARVDYNLSNNTQFYVRYARFHELDGTGVVNNSPYSGPKNNGYDTSQTIIDDNALLSLVHSVGSHLTEQSKFVYNRISLVQPLGANPVGPTLYWNKNVATTFDTQLLTLPGYNGFTPGNAIPFGGPQNFYQSYEDLTYVKGKHEFRFGGSYLFFQDNRTFGAYEEAVESLGTSGVNGRALQRLLTGNLRTFTTAIDPQGKFPCGSPGLGATDALGNPVPVTVTANCTITLPANQPSFSRSNRYNEFAFYGQDSWKARPHLTINLGLRWEYYGVQHNKNPLLDSNFYPGAGGSIFERIRNGDVSRATQSSIGGLWAKDWNNFAPRVGFAWDIFGNGKTSLRGGYGIGYERNFGNVTFNVIQNVPNYEVVDLTGGVDPGCCTITTSNLGGFSGTGTKTLPRASLRAVNPNIRNAYAHLYDAAIDRELAHNVFIAVEYSGSKGERLYSLDPVNRLGSGNVYFGDGCNGSTDPNVNNCTSRIRGQQYSTINFREGQGSSSYNALNIRFNITNAWNSGLNLTSNYTYAHAIDNLSTTFSTAGGNFDLGLLDPFNPHLDRGNADFDLRHRIAISGTWEIPFAKNTHGVLKQAAHGWVVAPIFIAHTGTPFTIFDSTNTFYQEFPRLILTAGVPRTGSAVPSGAPNVFNLVTIPNGSVAEFTNPVTGNSEFGPYPRNMDGRNAFRGPGTWNFDFGVHKKFFISERYTVELRGDAFDILNHANAFFVGGSNDFGAGVPGLAANTTVGAQSCKGTCLPSLIAIPQHRNLQLELRFAF